VSTVFAQISSKWGIADLTNAGIPLIRGNYADAGLSAIGAIPGFSDAIKGGAKIAKAAGGVASAWKAEGSQLW